MSKFAINGKFLEQEVTGAQRYAVEMLHELDKISNGMNISLVISKKLKHIPNLDNIKVIPYGFGKGLFWEQVSFVFYLLCNSAISINLCGVCPAMKPNGITVLLDIRNNVHREWVPQKTQAKLAAYWHIFQSWIICRFSKKIITISEFSKNEIVKFYKVEAEKISVIPCSWQHIDNASKNTGSGNYYFGLSSIAKHKNFKWILEVAKRNPSLQFKIAGSLNPKRFDVDLDFGKLPNVEFLGYVSDEDAQNLMQNAKAFLFPSIYEGFGIPPMESLALGTPVIVSDIPVMREVYGNSAHYIDPYNYDVDLENILQEPVASASEVLERYGWEKSAGMLKELLEAYADIA